MSSDEQKGRDREPDASPETEGSEAKNGEDPTDGPTPTGESGERGHSPPKPSDDPLTAEGEASEPAEPKSGDEQALEPKPAANTEPRKPGTATYYDDPYDDDGYDWDTGAETRKPAVAETKPSASEPPPPPPPPIDSDWDDDEEGMARMSFLDHLEELRKRLLHSIYGLAVVYLGCLLFAPTLFAVVAGPFMGAMSEMEQTDGVSLVALTPTETFYLLYVKLPLLVGVFLASPWLMYQAWSFIAPGLYKRERRWAAPFIFSTAALFVLGGVFGYFVALRYALAFLLGIGTDMGIDQMISIDSYFNVFIAIILGLGVVFQMPVVIFFLTLIRLVTPEFLLNNVRYAILIIFVIAAIMTPTADVLNLILFAGPMILLFYVGIFASYLLVLSREGRKLPAKVWLVFAVVLLLIAAGVAYYLQMQGYQFAGEFPWLVPPR